MKKFYLNNDYDHPLSVEISPTLAETLDESLDNMTISLGISTNKKPLAPVLNKVGVYEEDENTRTLINEFIISSDTVELITQNPLRYKHTVSLIQRSQFLTKHLIRNTVFSTSLEYANSMSSLIGGNICYKADNHSIAYNLNRTARTLSTKKIKSMVLKPSILSFGMQSVNHYTSGGGGGIDVEEYYDYYVKDKKINKWSDIFNSTQTPDYPIIDFEIYQSGSVVDTTSMQLQDFGNGDYIKVPETVIDFINQYTSGELRISIRNPIFDPTQWTLTPYNETNFPIFTKLTFEIFVDQLDLTVYDVIDTLIKQYRKDTKLYHDAIDLFNMPDDTHQSELYALLKNTQAPNFVFTQASMFDALSEIFRLFDATFRIDEDGYLEIEYFNDRKASDKFTLTESLESGTASALGEERYANRLVTYFQGTQVNDRFPNSNDEKATAFVRSRELGIPGTNDYVFEVPKPIDFIKKVYMESNYNVVSFSISLTPPSPTIDFSFEYIKFVDAPFNKVLDITDFVVESSIWSVLPSHGTSTPFAKKLTKQNTISYEKGTPYINACTYYKNTSDTTLLNTQKATINNVIKQGLCKELGIGNIVNTWEITFKTYDWKNLKLSVEYIALVDGKLVNESIDNKYDGEILTNQNNGSIDINKLGLNMVGLSLKLGQPTLTLTQKFTDWTNRIKKGQWFVDQTDNSVWVANTCSYVLIDNEHVQATIEFVKNFNALASRIELNREKRLTNISNELTVKCEENYGEFVYYTDHDIATPSGEQIALKDDFIRNSLFMTLGGIVSATNINLDYDVTSRVVDTTIATFNVANYNQKQLVRLTGYVENTVETDNPRGFLKLNENSNFSGNSIEIPVSFAIKACMHLNEITQEFEIDYSLIDERDFNALTPTSYIEQGNQVQVALVCDGQTILGAAILDDSNIPGETWYDLTKVILQYPSNDYKIEYALITALNDDNSIISIGETGQVKNIAIPMVVYGSGNSVCFEMSYDSPISAGNQLLDNYTYYYGTSDSTWGTATGWFSRSVLYTNEEGEAPKFTIDFVKMQEELTRYFPAMKKNDSDEFLETYSFGKLEEFAYYKKANEIFALNYQLHFLPFKESGREDCFLSNEFIKNNGFANGLNRKTLKFVYSTNKEYNILDTKGEGTTLEIYQIVSGAVNPNGFDISFYVEMTSELQATIKSWAIVDEDNNLYFSSNNGSASRSIDKGVFHLFFFWRHHRLV